MKIEIINKAKTTITFNEGEEKEFLLLKEQIIECISKKGFWIQHKTKDKEVILTHEYLNNGLIYIEE